MPCAVELGVVGGEEGVSPHYSSALLLQSRIRCCDEPSTGRLATRSLDVLLKYASGSRGSACPSHNATARFRDEPSWI